MTEYGHKTALMYACERGHLEAIKKLIEYHENINAQDDKGLTALMYAVMREQSEVIKFLLKTIENRDTSNYARQDKVDIYDYTALMWACKLKNKEILKLFIDKEGQYKKYLVLNQIEKKSLKYHPAKDENDYTVLMWASKNNHKEIVDALIEKILNEVREIKKSIPYWDDREKELINHGADINHRSSENYKTALICASEENNIEIVEKLLKAESQIEAILRSQ